MTQLDECGGGTCRYGANQYGAYYRFCRRHLRLALYFARTEGKSLEDWFDGVILQYIDGLKKEAS